MDISAEVVDRIADAPLSAHLATSVDGRPHVAPVWYVFESNGTEGEAAEERAALYVLTGGKKLANVRSNPRVAVSIERADGPDVDWSVQLLGTAREVEDDERIERVQTRMDEIYRGEGESSETDGDEAEAADGGEEMEWACLEIRVGSASYQQY
ncbi:pyridoxamine 5'-phosphate oxidase family protein [Haloarcula nitratireducens]|uniref:Pyridoxamine 5'-phosphate oxidase family protein n=1 Tax=Haloarcula nitratireducens TaxID=2487749 RepID=A0AAW4PGB5_9EURY|nr:pyridoxamine 5'-phosphate oxidase family protein [Halomicroarcula nitratireducens]MBX0296277.1 pyridoxamine 5'-phosphate oxidase family protein [Halomicroarcula nitratireducens]